MSAWFRTQPHSCTFQRSRYTTPRARAARPGRLAILATPKSPLLRCLCGSKAFDSEADGVKPFADHDADELDRLSDIARQQIWCALFASTSRRHPAHSRGATGHDREDRLRSTSATSAYLGDLSEKRSSQCPAQKLHRDTHAYTGRPAISSKNPENTTSAPAPPIANIA